MAEQKRIKILFLCTGNSCRSQMAEGFARHLRHDEIDAYSAGIAPKGIDPLAIKTMAEAGVDISGQSSNSVDDIKHIAMDYVITLCDNAHKTCPSFPAKTAVRHVAFDDPPKLAVGAANEESALFYYRLVRDEIRRFVERLPDSLTDEDSERAVDDGASFLKGIMAGLSRTK
jgi:arsenate reductase